MLASYFMDVASEAEVLAYLNRPDHTGIKLRAKDELWKKLGYRPEGAAPPQAPAPRRRPRRCRARRPAPVTGPSPRTIHPAPPDPTPTKRPKRTTYNGRAQRDWDVLILHSSFCILHLFSRPSPPPSPLRTGGANLLLSHPLHFRPALAPERLELMRADGRRLL